MPSGLKKLCQSFGLLIAGLFCVLCLSKAGYAQEAWQAGDLIFREGNEPVSDLVRLADRGLFSHVGMIIGQPGAWQVIHATPEEVPGRGNAVVIDDLAFFTAPERSLQYAIYQVQATPQQHEQAVAAALQDLGKPFSVVETGLYCTTLIENAWLAAGVDLQPVYTQVKLPMISGHYLLPSGLLASPLLVHTAHTEIQSEMPEIPSVLVPATADSRSIR